LTQARRRDHPNTFCSPVPIPRHYTWWSAMREPRESEAGVIGARGGGPSASGIAAAPRWAGRGVLLAALAVVTVSSVGWALLLGQGQPAWTMTVASVAILMVQEP